MVAASRPALSHGQQRRMPQKIETLLAAGTDWRFSLQHTQSAEHLAKVRSQTARESEKETIRPCQGELLQ